MNEPKKRPSWCQHPLILGLTCGIAVFAAATLVVATIPPAWAVSIPIGSLFGTPYVINLGDLPPWIGAIVLAMTWWEARKAKKTAAVSVATSEANALKIDAVATKIDGMLVDRDRANVKVGEAKGRQAGEETAATLAEGQRQGAASARAAGAPEPRPVAKEKPPLPVADERTAAASERVAKATERAADATEAAKK